MTDFARFVYIAPNFVMNVPCTEIRADKRQIGGIQITLPNGNAFVPSRAFGSPADADEFFRRLSLGQRLGE